MQAFLLDTIWYETFVRCYCRELLPFLTLQHLPPLIRTLIWPVLKFQGTKTASFGLDIFRGRPRPNADVSKSH